jgi:DUF4097 and DUF4098 domain-containing protein YvlB
MPHDRARLGLLLVVLSLPALAQTDVFQPHPGQWVTVSKGKLPSVRELYIKIDGGSVRIEGGSANMASYTVRVHHNGGTVADTVSSGSPYRIASYVRRETAWFIAGRNPQSRTLNTAEVEFDVPRDLELVKIDSAGGDISASGIHGRVQVFSGGGELSFEDIDGAIDAQTGGRDINVGRAGSGAIVRTAGGRISVRFVQGNLDAQTGGGNILVGSGMSNTSLETGAGDVHIELCGGELKVTGGGGNVVLGDVRGSADIRSGGGNIRLRSASAFVQAQTAAGNIDLQRVPAADARTEVGSISVGFSSTANSRAFPNSSLQTSVGDISVTLPSDLPITIEASIDLAAGHTIDSDFPEIPVSNEPDGPDRILVAKGKLNGGGPTLRIHTTNGDIRIKRAVSASAH